MFSSSEEYWDYRERRERERREENSRKRFQSYRSLTRAVLWLFEHDWSLLLSKNLYMIFCRGPEWFEMKLDGNIHVSHMIGESYRDCPDISLWQFLYGLIDSGLFMQNYNFLYFVKGDRMIVINPGNSSVKFIDNSKALIKVYEGWKLSLSDVNRLTVTGSPKVSERKSLKVKSGIHSISKSDMMNIRLRDVWIKETRRFGE